MLRVWRPRGRRYTIFPLFVSTPIRAFTQYMIPYKRPGITLKSGVPACVKPLTRKNVPTVQTKDGWVGNIGVTTNAHVNKHRCNYKWWPCSGGPWAAIFVE